MERARNQRLCADAFCGHSTLIKRSATMPPRIPILYGDRQADRSVIAGLHMSKSWEGYALHCDLPRLTRPNSEGWAVGTRLCVTVLAPFGRKWHVESNIGPAQPNRRREARRTFSSHDDWRTISLGLVSRIQSQSVRASDRKRSTPPRCSSKRQWLYDFDLEREARRIHRVHRRSRPPF